MSVPGVIIRDMEENFPFGRRPSRLRERASSVRDKEVKLMLSLLASGSRIVPMMHDVDELLENPTNRSKALIMIYYYYPVLLASKKLDDPDAISIVLSARIALKAAGLEKAAENVSKILKEIGRNIIGAIAEIANPEFARIAARAAYTIGKNIEDELLKAVGIELLRVLGEEINESYELEEADEIEMRFIIASTLVSLGKYEEALRYIEDIESEYAYFFKALIALLAEDKQSWGIAIARLKESETPEANALLMMLDAIKKAFIEGKEPDLSEIEKFLTTIEDAEARRMLDAVLESVKNILK